MSREDTSSAKADCSVSVLAKDIYSNLETSFEIIPLKDRSWLDMLIFNLAHLCLDQPSISAGGYSVGDPGAR